MRVLAIASIGGHWIQLLRLLPAFEDHNVTFISTNKMFQSTVEGYTFFTVPDSNRSDKKALLYCLIYMAKYVILTKPQIVITTGAAPGLIGIILGKLYGAKTIWIDSIANVEKLSMSGKIALKFADQVYTQWEHLATSNVLYKGNVLK